MVGGWGAGEGERDPLADDPASESDILASVQLSTSVREQGASEEARESDEEMRERCRARSSCCG